jgi:hypothetical protein
MYDTFLRIEMTIKTAWAVPSRMIASLDDRTSSLMRTLDGEEFIFSIGPGVEHLMQAELWKSLPGGARLPATLVAMPTEPSALRSSSEWRLEWPRKNCSLWYNENLSGMRLLDAEKREGSEVYLSRDVIRERTPRGFLRSPRDRYKFIFRPDDPNLPPDAISCS